MNLTDPSVRSDLINILGTLQLASDVLVTLCMTVLRRDLFWRSYWHYYAVDRLAIILYLELSIAIAIQLTWLSFPSSF